MTAYGLVGFGCVHIAESGTLYICMLCYALCTISHNVYMEAEWRVFDGVPQESTDLRTACASFGQRWTRNCIIAVGHTPKHI